MVINGCAPAPPSPPAPTDSPAPTTETGAAPLDTGVDRVGEPPEQVGGVDWEPTVTVDEVAEQTPDSSVVFDPTVLHTVAITLSDEARSALLSDPYSFVEGDIVVDGIELDDIAVRLRGRIGSFRDLTGKPKFKIEFNRYMSGQRLYDLDSISLNNAVVDCSYLKEPIAYEVFRAIGVPAPRAAMATVTVNGEDYGLYVLIETEDKRFLVHNFTDPSGNLYDGKYVWYGGSSYTLLDFGEGHDHLFQLAEGTDKGNLDISYVSYTLNHYQGESDYYAEMGRFIDWDEFQLEQLGEQWVGQDDGYGLNKNNYRIYFDPGHSNRMKIIPWDLDYSFLNDSDWGRSWATPYGRIAHFCMADSTCAAKQQALAADVAATIDALDLVGDFDALVALTADAAAADPKRECSWSSVLWYRSYVRSWLQNRQDYFRSFWGI